MSSWILPPTPARTSTSSVAFAEETFRGSTEQRFLQRYGAELLILFCYFLAWTDVSFSQYGIMNRDRNAVLKRVR